MQSHHNAPHNVYTRADYDIDMDEQCSPPKKFFETFREKMNLRSRRDSINEAAEIEVADEVFTDIELPPPYYDPPKECFDSYGHSVPADSMYLNGVSRLRSRSDATPQSVQKIGTLVLFPVAPPPSPNWSFEGKVPSITVTTSLSPSSRGDKHQNVCVGEMESRKGGRHLPLLRMPNHNLNYHNQTYVDTRLVSPTSVSEDKGYAKSAECSSATCRFQTFPLSPVSMPRTGCLGKPRAASSSVLLDESSSPIGNFALVFKENGSPSTPNSPAPVKPEFGTIVIESPEAAYFLFMKAHETYNLAPSSGLVVTFDLAMNVRQTFTTMVQNNFRAAALTDTSNSVYLALFTAQDFIEMAVRYYTPASGIDSIKKLERIKLGTWCRTKLKEGYQFEYLLAFENVFDLLEMMDRRSLHWLATVEPLHFSVMYCATFKRVLKYLCTHISHLPYPKFMQETPKNLGIGTWTNIHKVSVTATLIEVCHVMIDLNLTGVPIVDNENRLVGVFTQTDIYHLNLYERLEASMFEVIIDLRKYQSKLHTCTVNDNMLKVTHMMSVAYVHRLMVVDEGNHLIGVISARDLLRYMVLKPPVSLEISSTAGIAEAEGEIEAEAEADAIAAAEAQAKADKKFKFRNHFS